MTDPARPRLLYVEDEPIVLEIGVLTFEEAGFGVVAAQSVPEALAALGECGAQLDAVVTDIQLPGEGSGWRVARHARELVPNIPVVYVSGGNAHEWWAQGVPGSIMVTKPYAAAQLVAAVSDARRRA